MSKIAVSIEIEHNEFWMDFAGSTEGLMIKVMELCPGVVQVVLMIYDWWFATDGDNWHNFGRVVVPNLISSSIL